jgi:hypothetical protein
VLAALRVLLLEKTAQQIDDGVKPGWSTPHIEELAHAAVAVILVLSAICLG